MIHFEADGKPVVDPLHRLPQRDVLAISIRNVLFSAQLGNRESWSDLRFPRRTAARELLEHSGDAAPPIHEPNAQKKSPDRRSPVSGLVSQIPEEEVKRDSLKVRLGS